MGQQNWVLFGYDRRDIFFALAVAKHLKHRGFPLMVDRLDFGDVHATPTMTDASQEKSPVVGLIIFVSQHNIGTTTLQQTITDFQRRNIPVCLLVDHDLSYYPDKLNKLNIDPVFINRRKLSDERELSQICDILLDRFSRIEKRAITAEAQYLYDLITHLELHFGMIEDAVQGNFAKQNSPHPQYIKTWESPERYTLFTPAWERIGGYTNFDAILEDQLRFFLVGDSGSGKSTSIRQAIREQAHVYLEHFEEVNSPVFPVYFRLAHWPEGETAFENVLDAYIASLGEGMVHVQDMLKDGRAMLWIELQTNSEAAFTAIKTWIHEGHIPHRLVICVENTFSETFTTTGLELPIVEILSLQHNHAHQYAHRYFGDNGDFLLDAFIYPEYTLHDDGTIATITNLGQLGLLLHQYITSDDITVTIQTLSDAVVGFIRHRWQTHYTPVSDEKSISFDEMMTAVSRLATSMLYNDWLGFIPYDAIDSDLRKREELQVACDIGLLYRTQYGFGFILNEVMYFFAGRGLMPRILTRVLKPPQFTSRGKLVLTPWDRAVLYLLDQEANYHQIVEAVAEINPYLILSAPSRLGGDYALFVSVISRLTAFEETPSQATLERLAFFPPETVFGFLLTMARDETWHKRQHATQLLTKLANPEFPGLNQVLDSDMDEQVVSALKLLSDEIVPVLMVLLDHPIRRLVAMDVLGRLEDKAAVPAIIGHMKRTDDAGRKTWLIACLKALGQIADEESLDYLIPYLEDDDAQIREATVRAIVGHGKAALLRLQTLANHENPAMRALALSGLNKFTEPSAIELCLKAVEDSDPNIRVIAINGLSTVFQIDVFVALMKRIAAKDDEVAPNTGKTVAETAKGVLTLMGIAHNDLNPRKLKEERIQQIARRAFESHQASTLRKTAMTAKERLARVTRQNAGSLSKSNDGSDIDAINDTINGHLSQADIDELIAQLNDKNTQYRLDALRQISKTLNESLIDRVIACIFDPNRLVSELAVHVMQNAGVDALPKLQQMLSSNDINIRCAGLAIAVKIPDESLIPMLADCLQIGDVCSVGHINGRVSDLAAKCLLAIGTEAALEVLSSWRKQTFIDHASKHHVDGQVQLPSVPLQPAEPMGIVNYIDTFAGLLTQVRVAPWENKHVAARALHAQAKSLRKQAPQEIINLLVDVLDDPDWVMRWVACEALAWLADKRVIPAFKKAINDDHWNVRLTAIGGLLEIDDIALVNIIEPALKDPDAQVRELAAEAVGRLGGAKQIPALLNVIQHDQDDLVRFAAVVALGNIPNTRSIDTLLEVMKSKEVSIKWAAARSLSKVTNHHHVEALIPYLEDVDRPDWDDNRVCDWIEEALERIATPEAQQALKQWRFSMH